MPQTNPPKKVFITGANGFIGRQLASYYRALGAEVAGVDITATPEWNVVAGNINHPQSWREALCNSDLVIHTAAIVSMNATAKDAWHVSVSGTSQVLAAAAEAGVNRFVHISSIAAFGWDFPDGVSEDYPLMPNGNTYCDSKIASEHAVLAAHSRGDINCTIIRPGDVYGPASRPWTLLPLELIKAGQFLLPDKGQGVFSPVYIDDLVEGISLAANTSAGSGEIFTLTSGEGVSCMTFFMHHAGWAKKTSIKTIPKGLAVVVTESAKNILQLAGKKTELGRGALDILSRHGTYSIDKARNILGYTPKVSLDDGIKKTELWLRQQALI